MSLRSLFESLRRPRLDPGHGGRDRRTREARQRALFAGMTDGLAVYAATPDGQDFILLDINDAALRIRGMAREAALGTPLGAHAADDTEVGLRQVLRRVSAGGTPECHTWRRTSAGGVTAWYEDLVYRLSTGELAVLCRDVTARRRAEEDLRASREVLHGILNAIPVRVFWKDLNLVYQGCNSAFAQDAGFARPEDLVGKDDFAMGWRDQAELYRADDLAVIMSGEARLLFDEPQTTPAGDQIHLLTNKLPLRDDAGAIVGVLGTYYDITTQRRAEEAQARLEDQLRQAQKLEAVGQLAAGIAHEINTPAQFVGDNLQFLSTVLRPAMALIAAYREGAAALPPSPATDALRARLAEREVAVDIDFLLENVPAALAAAGEGVARISTIVSAMREFAHPDRVAMEPADINRALEATLTVARNAYKRVADIETEFGELPPVVCHVGELNQVFLGLLVNAARAIADLVGDSGARGLIRLRTVHEGDHVRIDITDSGVGMPAEIRARVFDPFFTTRAVGQGSGQGLAVAYAIVTGKHGGQLSCVSEVGRGSTFSVRLAIEGPCAAVARAA